MPTPSTAAPSRQWAAILFADIHGYSRLMNKDELGTCQRVTRSIELIRSLIGDYGGRVVQTAGDGVLALFGNSCQALRFAVEMQREFRNDIVWNADGDVIAFRIGIHLGYVLLGEASVQGHSVNIAARLQELAKPGGICITGMVRDEASDAIDLPIRTLGARKLKNIADPIEIFAIEINGPTADQSIEVNLPSDPLQLEPDQVFVAVLPLDNLSGDPRDNHLCHGITGDTITNLSRFRDFAVIAKHSAMVIKLRGLLPAQLNEQLGIRYVISGGLQRMGGKIRLQVELIEAATQHVLWSERLKGDLGDIFSFQEDVTDVVSARLAIQITEAERRRLARLNPPDIRAYGLILRGQDLYKHFRREANAHARRLFEQATAIDPGFSRSYAAMSRTFNLDWRYAWSEGSEAALDKAVDLAKAAIECDGGDARGYAELGFARLYKKQHEESLSAYERAYQLNPNDADLLAEMGDSLVYSGNAKRAVNLLERAIRLNPYHPDWYLWYLGDAFFHMAEYEKTIDVLKRMRNQDEAHRLLASSYALIGEIEQARMHGKKLMQVHPNFSIDHWRKVPPNKFSEDLDIFIEGLRKAGLE